jgi:hypothetical protein
MQATQYNLTAAVEEYIARHMLPPACPGVHPDAGMFCILAVTPIHLKQSMQLQAHACVPSLSEVVISICFGGMLHDASVVCNFGLKVYLMVTNPPCVVNHISCVPLMPQMFGL